VTDNGKVAELEDRVATQRQEMAAQRIEIRELKQKLNDRKASNKSLQQEIARLNGQIREKDDELRIAQSVATGFNRMESALKGVIAERYKEPNTLGHDCKWCSPCTLKVWEAANVAVGKKPRV